MTVRPRDRSPANFRRLDRLLRAANSRDRADREMELLLAALEQGGWQREHALAWVRNERPKVQVRA